MNGHQRATFPLHLRENLHDARAILLGSPSKMKKEISHLKKEKRREKIIPKLSMTKMDRIPLCFCFLVLSKRIVTKYFTIALYYFSSNRVQVFLMKQQ